MSNSRYDAVAHLRASLLLKANDTMAMLTVYCDDSGTHSDSHICVVAGYLSSTAQWERFTKEWKRALNDFGINAMHRADLESFKGEFEQWDPERRTSFLKRLQPIIKHRTKTPIASVVLKDDFEQVMPSGLKREMGGVYGFLAYFCLVGVGQWCSKSSRQHAHPIQWVFEAGTKGRHQIEKMFDATLRNEITREKSRLGGWSFMTKSIHPLQSADLLAYECFKLINSQVIEASKKRPVRISMRELVGSEHRPYMRFFGRPILENFVKEWEKHGIRL